MDVFFFILQIIGVIGFSVSGAMVAIRRENDIVGVILLSLTTAFGGGILRDLCISSDPPRFFTMYTEIAVSVGSALAVFFLARLFKTQYLAHEKALLAVDNIFDAIGIAAFSVIGTELSVKAGYAEPLIAITMGTLSCIGGGMIRDVLVRDIPFVLKKRIYAVATLSGAALYYLLYRLGAAEYLSLSLGAALVFILRMLATVFEWDLPKAIDFSAAESAESENKREKSKKV